MSTMKIAQPAQSTAGSGLRSIIARHPLAAYFVLAFIGAWIPLLPPVLAGNGLGLLPFLVSDIAFLVLFVLATFAGPTLAAVVVTAATEGKPGLRHLLRRYVQWRVGIGWYLVALFGYLVLALVTASFWFGAVPLQSLLAQWPLIVTSYLPWVLGMLIVPSLGEEPGWRGFALPRLQQQYGPVPGSLLLGLLVGVWHLPVFLLTIGPAALGPFDVASFARNTGMIMVLTIIWTWVVNNAGGSILMAMLLHAALNATNQFIPQVLPAVPEETGGLVSQGLYIGAALLVIIFTRGRLSYKPDQASPNELHHSRRLRP